MELYSKGYLDDVSVDIENQRALTKFLDAGKLEIVKQQDFGSISMYFFF